MGNTCGQYCARDDAEPQEFLTVDNKVSQPPTNSSLHCHCVTLSLFLRAVWQVDNHDEAIEEVCQAHRLDHTLAGLFQRLPREETIDDAHEECKNELTYGVYVGE